MALFVGAHHMYWDLLWQNLTTNLICNTKNVTYVKYNIHQYFCKSLLCLWMPLNNSSQVWTMNKCRLPMFLCTHVSIPWFNWDLGLWYSTQEIMNVMIMLFLFSLFWLCHGLLLAILNFVNRSNYSWDRMLNLPISPNSLNT